MARRCTLVSDMRARCVYKWDGDLLTRVVDTEDAAGGIGWTPSGELLVVLMKSRKLIGHADGNTRLVADLEPLATGSCNDMVVTRTGTAYVGVMDAIGAVPTPTFLIAVSPDGNTQATANGVLRPNGCVVTPDGSRLIVAETSGACLTSFEINDDGTLHDRRAYASISGLLPDGICIDREGAVWVADLATNTVLRILEGGSITDRISTGERYALACVLGGLDGRTLYVCTTEELNAFAGSKGTGRIETTTVQVPG